MTAGRELDAVIATKVMGWHASNALGYGTIVWYPPGLTALHNMLGHTLPAYSTDIAAAWQAIEELHGHPDMDGEEIEVACVGKYRNGYQCELIVAHGAWTAEADTAPLAICLAALEALGVPLDK